jgi:hypothetical protein
MGRIHEGRVATAPFVTYKAEKSLVEEQILHGFLEKSE